MTASAEIGGGNRSLLSLWPGLIARGFQIQVMCPTPGPMVEACGQQQIPCHVVEYGQPGWREPNRLWHNYRRWSTILRATGTDIVHANALAGARSISLATWMLGLPLVCHIRFPPETGLANWVFRGLPKPDFFVFNSRALQKEAGDRLRRAYPRVGQEVVYNGVDLASFRSTMTSAGSNRRVGIIANLSAIKGHEDFLHMVRLLIDRGCGGEFWIVGTDITQSGYDRHLISLAEELGILPSVKFLGFQTDVPRVISQLDVIVSSSHYESFGRTLVEAMACERPVVATAVGGVLEVVADGITGLLVPPRNPNALADAVASLLDDRDLRQRMGRAGRERAERLFSVDACADHMTDLYCRVLGGSTVATGRG